MANLLTSGRKHYCNSLQGGIKAIYLAGFVPYSRTRFEFDGLVLTYIPTTFVNRFDLRGSDNNYTVGYDGESYTQSLNVTFQKQDSKSTQLFNKLAEQELRALVLDNNGNYVVLGLDNGLNSDSLEIVSGGQHGEFNGYRMKFSGKEKYATPLVLDPFGNGFIEVEDGEIDFYQFQDLEAFQFQDGTQYEFN